MTGGKDVFDRELVPILNLPLKIFRHKKNQRKVGSWLGRCFDQRSLRNRSWNGISRAVMILGFYQIHYITAVSKVILKANSFGEFAHEGFRNLIQDI
jgi:hypothetical protein